MSKTLLFFGNERLSTGFEPSGAPTFEALVQAGYEIKAVIAHNSATKSRNARDLGISTVAKKYGVEVLLPPKPSDIEGQLASYHADAAILVAYGNIIPQSIIDLFPRGIINIHPSLLPLYRGPTPIEQVIRDGASETGVSLMQLSHEMDKGPVYAQQKIPLKGSETKTELAGHLLDLGGALLIKNLPAILNGSLAPSPQDEEKATYSALLTKDDGQLDITKPAEQLEREIRAFAVWPKAKLSLHGFNITVINAKAAPSPEHGLTILCGNETYLEITDLIAPSGKKMSGADFLRGYVPK